MSCASARRAVGAVSPQDAVRLMNQGATVLDLRAAEDFAAGHIRGARNLAAGAAHRGPRGAQALQGQPLIVYCERGSSRRPRRCGTLAQQGFTKVVNLRGGLSAWRAENLPAGARLSRSAAALSAAWRHR